MGFNIENECKKLSNWLNKVLNILSENRESNVNRDKIENKFNIIKSYFSEGYTYSYMNNKDSQRIVHESIEQLFEELDAFYDYSNNKSDLNDMIWKFKNKLYEFEKNIIQLD